MKARLAWARPNHSARSGAVPLAPLPRMHAHCAPAARTPRERETGAAHMPGPPPSIRRTCRPMGERAGLLPSAPLHLHRAPPRRCRASCSSTGQVRAVPHRGGRHRHDGRCVRARHQAHVQARAVKGMAQCCPAEIRAPCTLPTDRPRLPAPCSSSWPACLGHLLPVPVNKGRGVLLVPFFFYWSRLHELEKVSKTMGWVEEGGRWHSKKQRCRQEFEVTRASWT